MTDLTVTEQVPDAALTAWLLACSADWERENSCFGYRANTPEDLAPERVLIACAAGERAGYLFMHRAEAKKASSVMPDGTPYLEIEELYVLPAYRSQGIGRRLFAAAEETAKREGLSFVMLSTATKNARAILHFYIDELDMTFWSARLFKKV